MWREALRTWEALAFPESLEDARDAVVGDTDMEPQTGKPRNGSRPDSTRSGSRVRKVKQVSEPTERREAEDRQGVRSAHSTQRAGKLSTRGRG